MKGKMVKRLLAVGLSIAMAVTTEPQEIFHRNLKERTQRNRV